MKEYVIYSGEKFTIEWFYNEQGKSDSREYFTKLDRVQKQKFLHLVKRMGDAGKIHDKTKFRNEGDKIYAFKPQPDRFLSFFFEGRKIIVTNAFVKRQDKLPQKEKHKALRCMESYIKRVKEGTYYEK